MREETASSIATQTIQLRLGDSFEIILDFEANSIGAIVCDPPYGLSFMGKDWDDLSDVPEDMQGVDANSAHAMTLWHQGWLKEAYRVLVPGGVIKAFSATRTFHRLAQAMQIVGFQEIHIDAWVYGSGFPKSMDLSKAIDNHLGATRTETLGPKAGHEGFVDRPGTSSVQSLKTGAMGGPGGFARPWMDDPDIVARYHWKTAPATPEAARFTGYGTALKPAWEPFVVGQKP